MKPRTQKPINWGLIAVIIKPGEDENKVVAKPTRKKRKSNNKTSCTPK